MAITARDRLRKRAIRGDQCLSCCENQASIINGQISNVLSQILAALDSADGTQNLALVPAPLVGIRVITILEAASRVPVLGAAVTIVAAAELLALARTAAAYDMLSIVATTVGQLFGTRDTGCAKCVESRALSQSAPRQRQRAKINRRL